MSGDAVVLLLLAVCCTLLCVLQAAEWRGWLRVTLAIGVCVALIALGDLASHTSTATLLDWLRSPSRRQDLAALLLIEAALFGAHAMRVAQATDTRAWRLLGCMPPPSFLLVAFFGQVVLLLNVDGWDYASLSLAYGICTAVIWLAAVIAARWLLPDSTLRALVRIALHVAEVVMGLWLARPVFAVAIEPTPVHGARLAMLAAASAALALIGWLWQSRRSQALRNIRPHSV